MLRNPSLPHHSITLNICVMMIPESTPDRIFVHCLLCKCNNLTNVKYMQISLITFCKGELMVILIFYGYFCCAKITHMTVLCKNLAVNQNITNSQKYKLVSMVQFMIFKVYYL